MTTTRLLLLVALAAVSSGCSEPDGGTMVTTTSPPSTSTAVTTTPADPVPDPCRAREGAPGTAFALGDLRARTTVAASNATEAEVAEVLDRVRHHLVTMGGQPYSTFAATLVRSEERPTPRWSFHANGTYSWEGRDLIDSYDIVAFNGGGWVVSSGEGAVAEYAAPASLKRLALEVLQNDSSFQRENEQTPHLYGSGWDASRPSCVVLAFRDLPPPDGTPEVPDGPRSRYTIDVVGRARIEE